jgi:hypothetical protein
MKTNETLGELYRWTIADTEMGLEEALDDPIVRLVMKSDHLDHDKVLAFHHEAQTVVCRKIRNCGRLATIPFNY